MHFLVYSYLQIIFLYIKYNLGEVQGKKVLFCPQFLYDRGWGLESEVTVFARMNRAIATE